MRVSGGSSPHRVLPRPLADVPAVNALLTGAELGPLEADSVTSFPGRNDNWAGTTRSGRGVFVKRVGGDREESLGRLHRALTFERWVDRRPARSLRRPRCLGSDEPNRLLVFELLDATSGNELLRAESLGPQWCREAGLAIGTLHGLPVEPGDGLDRSPHPLPPLDFLQALPLGAFQRATMAELAAWRLLQRDRELARALTELRRQEADAAPTPVHGDLRLDQIATVGEELHILDWEEFRLADPARDVGSVVGELLWHAIVSIPDPEEGDDAELEPSPGAIATRGVQRLARFRPLISAFWNGYRAARPRFDTGLAERACAFAGWHMFDRLLAGGGVQGRLSALQRAAAGIGRNVLLAPGSFRAVLGLGDDT
ncbi:hypothetical protein GCM10012275_13840 [Longimycelium tulufanense]|uniref:Aminoglycoside phosphotransferase domain-containing protein n=1 Tax=Longimycelium tulufanense TaxID=907463 RepID=A0A8J3C6X1_9PSEU|nr:class V lanthionine synthetase subunit LxmK [Longimycelium tulufanense]GGM44057.1 hypothetical protein GCM10012275_13840 [Longimycelium tulufanense]